MKVDEKVQYIKPLTKSYELESDSPILQASNEGVDTEHGTELP